MRQVTRQAVNAFMNYHQGTFNNTTVCCADGIANMYLFGHMIATKRVDEPVLKVSFAGWPTVTTKERLNGLVELMTGKRPFHTVKGQLCQYNQPIDDEKWIEIKLDTIT